MTSAATTIINNVKHYPVLYREVFAFYKNCYSNYWEQTDKTNSFYLADGTFGGGNHARLLLNQFKNMKIAGYDLDPQMIEEGEENFSNLIYKERRLKLTNDTFFNILTHSPDTHFRRYRERAPKLFNSIFLDLGFNSHTDSNTAADILNNCTPFELETLFKPYDSNARLISEAICKTRETDLINTTSQLKKVLLSVFPGIESQQKYHKIMKIFMALRIAVNSELLVLENFLSKDPINNLTDDGSIAIISFHSLEDKIVSDNFKRWKIRKLGDEYTKKVITPGEKELSKNPASSSAKMRIFVKKQQDESKVV